MTRETPEEHQHWYGDAPFAEPFKNAYTRRGEGILSNPSLFHTLSETFVLGGETIVITPETWHNGEQ